jgi:hypothetical protein
MLRLDAGGDPVVAIEDFRSFSLARRRAGTWSCEPLPLERPDRLSGLAPAPGGGVLVAAVRWLGDRYGLIALEHDGTSWRPAEHVADVGYFRGDVEADVAADGRTLLLFDSEYIDEKFLAVREAGSTVWARYPLPAYGHARARFGADGKIWVLDEISPYGATDRVRSYPLFVER